MINTRLGNYTETEELLADVMRLGAAAEITAPPALRQQLCDQLRDIRSLYD